MKICKICKIEKDLNLFYKREDSKDGFRSECKECLVNKSIEYSKNNKDKRKYIMAKYYLSNSDDIRMKSKQYQELNKEKNKITRYKNRYKRQENYLNKISTDDLFKLSESIRNSIRTSIKKSGYSKKTRTYKILGCSYEDFKIYIESKFEPWMTWENHGKYNGELNYGWDFDHIIPISSAKNEEEIIKLNYYTNFQPLCSKVNRDIKKDQIPAEMDIFLI